MDLGDADLTPMRVLGEGSYGRVFLCKSQRQKTKRFVCVKRIIVQNPKMEMGLIMEEVYIISQLRHPRIVQFIRSFVHAGTVNIVMEFLPNGTMRNRLDKMQHVPITRACLLQYFCDILLGIEYLHIRHVIHRDLKPENLLLDERNRIKIADFGISTVHTSCRTFLNARGTPYYMAPEVLRGEKFDFKSDIWSLGCVLYEMCSGRSPFSAAHNLDELRFLVRDMSRGRIDGRAISLSYGSVWGELCERMLVYDPQKRIALPHILLIDPLLTIPYYRKYFEYNY